MEDEYQTRRSEEMDALEAIYGSDCVRVTKIGGHTGRAREEGTVEVVRVMRTMEGTDESEGVDPNAFTLGIVYSLASSYPSTRMPGVKLEASWIPKEKKEQLAGECLSEHASSVGEVMLFPMTEWLHEQCASIAHTLVTDARKLCASNSGPQPRGSEARAAVAATKVEPPPPPPVTMDIFTGEALTHKKSTFQAHVVDVSHKSDLRSFRTQLEANNKIASATHNILAYRFLDATTGVLHEDFDDDGESAAGKRLLQLLQLQDEDNLAVVVTRWFGVSGDLAPTSA